MWKTTLILRNWPKSFSKVYRGFIVKKSKVSQQRQTNLVIFFTSGSVVQIIPNVTNVFSKDVVETISVNVLKQ